MDFSLRKERRLIWLVSVGISAILVSAACSGGEKRLDEKDWYQRFSALVARYHGEGRCILCGMLHSFSACARGDIAAAHEYNRIGPYVFVLLIANVASGVVYIVQNVRQGAT